jgi:ribosomal protein S12 methylthiotransferase
VDSEILLGLLTQRGAQVVEDPAQARTILVNTCAFLESAVREALDAIFELAEHKKTGITRTLAVFGCLPERYRGELAGLLPEVDLIWGAGVPDQMIDRLPGFGRAESLDPADWPEPGFAPETPQPRLRSAPFYRAYLKIAEGCGNACAYCLIPQLRGRFRSRPMDALAAEAEGLAASGVRELILVAQDTTAYGRDRGETRLADLLRELGRIDGIDWLRVMYAYPSGVTRDLIRAMAQTPKVVPYIDLPLQHASPDVLKKMKRPHRADPRGLIEKLRGQIPDLRLRTTMMVGFPGETEKDFEYLMEFVEQVRFDHLGVFKFSPEEGTAAARMPNPVPGRTKENRRRKLMALQRRISRSINRSFVGRIEPVLIEGPHPETELLLVGRTRGQAPEIDGVVYINQGAAAPGDIRPVRITEAHDYDLVGEIVD